MTSSSPSRSLRLALASVFTFGAGVLIGYSAEAQPRFQHRTHPGAVVVVQSMTAPSYYRPHRFRVRPLPVVIPAPVVVRPAPVVMPAPVVVPPAPVVERDAHGILVTEGMRLRVGQAVRAQWGAGWFDAQVIAVEGSGVRIHYTGYSDQWNEVVPTYRLRLPG